MKVEFSLQFNRKKKLNKQGKAPVEVRAYYLGKNKYIATKINVDPLHWNEKKKEITPKNDQYISLNLQLRKILSDFETLQTGYIISNKAFTLETLSEHLDDGAGKSFTEFCQREKKANNGVQTKTLIAHQNTLNKLKELKNDILFSEINYDLIQRFDYMLRSQGYAVNTIDKFHKNFIIYINIAIKKGFIEMGANPYKYFKRTRAKTNKLALGADEIKLLENLTFTPKEAFLEKIRDLFLLACYTGLRISDALRLNCKNVYKNEEGWVIENIKSKKSNKDIFIPLDKLFPNADGISKPVVIIEKYYNTGTEPFFSKISEPYINRRLKEIGHLANIEKKITFHMARNTFATIMAQIVATPILQALLQHSNINTTMVYVKIGKQMIKEGVNKINWN